MDKNDMIYMASADELDAVKTFECGQCFRWNMDEDGAYTGVVREGAAKLVKRGDDVYFAVSDPDRIDMWREYFDLGFDYESARLSFDAGDYLRKCSEFGRGIRILRQEPWEALCSFIISQCNNIPRIKKIVETLCRCFGEPVDFCGQTLYTFPSAERLAELAVEDLVPLRCGYRAPYIISAARSVADGEMDLDALAGMSFDDAVAKLRTLDGVGPKVANCVALYGLHQMSGFPIDTWMKRALKEHFPPDFDPAVLGENAGLAQQYIFYYARSGGN